MTERSTSRRTALRRFGVALVGVMAGCSGRTDDRTPAATDPDSETGSPPTETPTETETPRPDPEGEPPADSAWISDLGVGATNGTFSDAVQVDGTVVCSGVLDGDPALVALDPNLDVQWSHTYPDRTGWESYSQPDVPVSVAADGGFTVGAAATNVDDEGLVFKTDSKGRIEWTRRIEGPSLIANARLVDLGDGSYAYAWLDRGTDIAKTFVAGFEPGAEPRWEREYEDYILHRMAPTLDGGCFLSGTGLRTGLWMAKLEADGTEAWRYVVEDYRFENGRPTDDGFVLWSTMHDDGLPVGSRVRVLDADREERWTREYEFTDSFLHTVAPIDDGYLLVNRAAEGFLATKLGSAGEIAEQTRYGVAAREDVDPYVAVGVSGRTVIAGELQEGDTPPDGWIVSVGNK